MQSQVKRPMSTGQQIRSNEVRPREPHLIDPLRTGPEYQIGSRRPIAEFFRRPTRGVVQFCVNAGVHPDLVSYASVVAAAGAGICFWQAQAFPALLILAVTFCYLRLW